MAHPEGHRLTRRVVAITSACMLAIGGVAAATVAAHADEPAQPDSEQTETTGEDGSASPTPSPSAQPDDQPDTQPDNQPDDQPDAQPDPTSTPSPQDPDIKDPGADNQTMDTPKQGVLVRFLGNDQNLTQYRVTEACALIIDETGAVPEGGKEQCIGTLEAEQLPAAVTGDEPVLEFEVPLPGPDGPSLTVLATAVVDNGVKSIRIQGNDAIIGPAPEAIAFHLCGTPDKASMTADLHC